MAEVTDQQIADAAATPATVSVDGVSVTNRPVKDLIDAQERVAQSRATSPRRGLQFTKLVPGSAVGK